MILAVLLLMVLCGALVIPTFKSGVPGLGIIFSMATLVLAVWLIVAAASDYTVEEEKTFTIQALTITDKETLNVVIDGEQVIDLNSIGPSPITFGLNLGGYKIRRTIYSPWRGGIHCIDRKIEWKLLGK